MWKIIAKAHRNELRECLTSIRKSVLPQFACVLLCFVYANQCCEILFKFYKPHILSRMIRMFEEKTSKEIFFLYRYNLKFALVKQRSCPLISLVCFFISVIGWSSFDFCGASIERLSFYDRHYKRHWFTTWILIWSVDRDELISTYRFR